MLGYFFFELIVTTAISAGVTPRVEIARYTKISLVLPRIAVLATARSRRSKAAGEVKAVSASATKKDSDEVRIRGGTESGPS